MNTDNSKVAIVSCKDYKRESVLKAVKKGVELIGGFEKILSSYKNILINPNALMGTKPNKHATTNPSVMWAVAKLMQDYEFNLSYGDAPGGVMPVNKMMKSSGFHDIAEELNISLADFENGDWKSVPNGLSSKKLFIANGVLTSDAVVSLSKLKSHGLVRYTGAIKNSFGCLPGMVKGEAHSRFPDPYDFSKLIVDVANCVNPKLHIMDAVIAMEGNGPQSGVPKFLGVMLFSTDPVALDTVACKIINLNHSLVPYIVEGNNSDLGISDLENISIVGDDINQFIDNSFDVVREPLETVPQGAIKRFVRNVTTPRPVILQDKCVQCGTCIEACPVDPKALNWNKGNKKTPPMYNYKECIRCFCCQEMCPYDAIIIHTPFWRKFLPPISYLGLMISMIRRKVRRLLGHK